MYRIINRCQRKQNVYKRKLIMMKDYSDNPTMCVNCSSLSDVNLCGFCGADKTKLSSNIEYAKTDNESIEQYAERFKKVLRKDCGVLVWNIEKCEWERM